MEGKPEYAFPATFIFHQDLQQIHIQRCDDDTDNPDKISGTQTK